jgi:predicted methyltransferase
MRLLIALALLAPSWASADHHTATMASKIEAAMAAEDRPESHRDRDRNRKPVETLEFFGIEDDMRVLELIPGGGWYTRLLAPALRDNGKLYVALNTNTVKDQLLGEAPFDRVDILAEGVSMERREGVRGRHIDPMTFGVRDLDAVLTFRNIHNLSSEGRANLNKAVFDALKPGGVYGVVDHTRRHMQRDDNENGRRVDPVLAIQELLEAGFEMVGYSDLHYRADDELRYEVGRKTVTGNTDRFTLLFRKPE